LDLVASGKINVKPLVTHWFSLENVENAFQTAKSGHGMKIMINCSL
jgi:L-iditol 2-dehydrogenase